MSITSASTQADIIGQYLDNLGYDHSGSTSACQAFIQACRALLVMHPSQWEDGQDSIRYDPTQWRLELNAAQVWLNANTTTSGNGSVKSLAFGGEWR